MMDEDKIAYNDPIKPGDTGTSQNVSTQNAGRDYKAWSIFAAGVGAVLWGLVSGIGTGWGFWSWKSGLTGVTWSFFVALAAILLGLFFGWRARKKQLGDNKMLRWGGMGVALLYSGYIISFVATATSLPAIHDISTDLAEPPQFAHLTLRTDNLDNIPGEDDSNLKGMSPAQRWAVLHQKGYPDIRSVKINQDVPQIIEHAERLAKARNWDIAVVDPVNGRLEATEASRFFGFKDDIILRVRPSQTPGSSIVDMRSVSRVGQSDIGVNAKRIRNFMADLSGTVTAK